MVFEAIVVEVLNKALGEYVENLDTSQLKIGIWGGDVVLKDLALKQTALNDLNLPVKVTWGQLGKLVLKIPWKNLYSAPVVVNIEDLFLLVSPESEVTYLPEREERWSQEEKQAKLARIEEAKKRKAEKDAIKADDTFVEKLTTQIVKNVQVLVERIHIRYEDRTTRSGSFCVGATINRLAVQTTDENGAPCFAADTVRFIFKALTLDGLALYWNPYGELLSTLSPEERLQRFKSDIPSGSIHPPGYTYLFGPLSSSASLILNSKPETDGTNFNKPKLELDVKMAELTVAMTKRQFQDMMMLVENLDRMNKGKPFRKFRPSVDSYTGHCRKWWKFAFTCVMVDIKRRRNDWDWTHMLLHRQRCRTYQKVYAKVLSPKPPPDAIQQARQLEAELDILNLILLRERAALDAQRITKAEEEAKANRGWFSGWFRSQPTAEDQFSDVIAKKIESSMTAEEKEKLYEAIGYEENATPAIYPATFIEKRLRFVLQAVRVLISDDDQSILTAELKDLRSQLEQRPAANALKASVSFGDFTVLGVKQPEGVAQLVSSKCSSSEHLIDVCYETNPLDGRCDQRVLVTAHPLTIIYNHETITKLQDIFASADASGINQVKARTKASLPTFKQMSAMGLEFAVEKRSRLDVQIHVSASTILVPHMGIYLPDRPMLLLRLGQLTVETDEQKTASDVSVRKLFLQGSTEEEIFSSILSASYANFNCRLTGIQVLMRLEKEKWENILDQGEPTSLHILHPTDLQVTVKKALITEDARIPKMVIEGILPSININVLETRILALAALVFSITETASPNSQEGHSRSSSMWSLASFSTGLEQIRKLDNATKTSHEDHDVVQGTDLACQFKMNEFVVAVKKAHGEFLKMSAVELGVSFVKKTLDSVLDVTLTGIEVTQNHHGQIIPVLASTVDNQDKCLVSFNVTSCERTSPELWTKKGGVLTSVQLMLSKSNIVLHQAALLSLLDFANGFSKQIDDVKQIHAQSASPKELLVHRKLSDILEEGPQQKQIVKPRRNRKHTRDDLIELKADIVIKCVAVRICGEQPIANFAIEGVKLGVLQKRVSTSYNIALQGLLVDDLNPDTIYRKVVSSKALETISANITMFNKQLLEEMGEFEVDIRVKAGLGRLRLIFLQRFINQLVEFGNSFQTAKDAVKEASAAAAVLAKQNMIKAYDDATKISLDVHIEAPLIVVPKNSRTNDALAIDLGVASITNSFVDLKSTTLGTPVIDTIQLKLREMKMTRALVDAATIEVIAENPMLEPVTFQLVVKRNLSAAWYREQPDLQISSRLGSIQVGLNQMDYVFSLAVLEENIGQGGASNQEKKVGATIPKDREGNAAIPAVHTAVQFDFSMESFVISLYPGGNKRLSEGFSAPERKHGLAQFVLHTLEIKGEMYSDSALKTTIRLVNCLLEDTRIGKAGRLTKLLERKIDDQKAGNMITIVYSQNGSQKEIDIQVTSFTLIISVDYLMKISSFFTVDKAVETSRNKKVKEQFKPMEYQTAQTSDASDMTVNIRVEKPDITLVESMDDMDTDALVFHTEIVLKYRTKDERQIINGTLNELQLYSCAFNPAKRKSTMKQVVKPLTLSVAGSTPEGQGLNVEVRSTNIAVAVTPATIQLINQCYAALNTSQSSVDEDEKEVDWSLEWHQKKFNEESYWFLKADEALEAEEGIIEDIAEAVDVKQELCIFDIPSIIITIEIGMGKRTNPMILLEMGISGQAKNWSSDMLLDTTLSFGMQYYNPNLQTWEPLVEPVELKKGRLSEFLPWQLSCQVAMCKDVDESKPGMRATITARDALEVTVSRTCLDVLTQLSESFATAVSATPNPQPLENTSSGAALLIQNDTGVSATILVADSQLKVANGKDINNVELGNGEKIELRYYDVISSAPGHISYSSESPTHNTTEHFLLVKLPQFNNVDLKIPLDRAVKRYYPVPKPGNSPITRWAVVAEVSSSTLSTTVTLRSTVQIINHFTVTIDVHYMSNQGNEVVLVGSVEPQDVLNLPLHAIFTLTGEIFFNVDGYYLSIIPFELRRLEQEMAISQQLQCDCRNKENVDPFFIKAVGEVEQVFNKTTTRHSLESMCYNIHLLPTVELVNSLPAAITLAAQGGISEVYIKPGAKAQIPHFNPGSSHIVIRISDYLEKEWSCKLNISTNPQEFTVWSFESFNSAVPFTLNLGVHCLINRGSYTLTLYCPFWMINKTGKQLTYKLDDTTPLMYHPANFHDPIMLSPNSRKFLGKKKGQVKIDQGEWSDKFSLDVAGSSGMVDCLDNNGKTLKLSVMIKLSHSSLTKMIVFTPAHVIVNKTLAGLELQEDGSDSWLEVKPEECVPLWPNKGRDSQLRIRVKETVDVTPLFHFHSTQSCLLKLNNKYGGVFADVQNTAGGVYIYLNAYESGLAPVLLLNHTDKHISFEEKGATDSPVILAAGSCQFYAWQKPTGEKKIVLSTGTKEKIVLTVSEDKVGEDKHGIWYVSFLDGLQRTLVLTNDEKIAFHLNKSSALEKQQFDVTLNLHGLGVSIVNNRPPQSVELLYMGLVSSGIVWETKKESKSRWKPLPLRESGLIEKAFEIYTENKARGRDPLEVIDNKYQVNLETMELLAPSKRKLRRTFLPGLSINLQKTEHSLGLFGKVNRLQLDNQTQGAIFPVILAPVPPPKTVAAEEEPKPFVQFSILQRVNPYSTVQQYKYFKVLVQEFHVKLDIGFVNALLSFIAPDETPEAIAKAQFLNDVQLSRQPLLTHIAVISSQEHKDFYDELHFSPLKIHLSFSMAGNLESKTLPPAFSLLLQSVGVTLTDIQDAVFRLSCMERRNLFLTRSQLIGEATSHYSGQALRQVYVLLLGLDVIGNPYGLVTGIGEGVEALFYEPFQGMIQGPSEFAEGLALGVKSLFGHTVGGAAGAFGRITGTLGKGLAVLSMDKEYQQQRLEQQHRRPDNIQASVAQGGRGLVMGVFKGVTGVVTKPLEGAREEGVGGFFKGMGKGVVGLVTRPVTGVVDFASTSLNAVKRATDQGSEVTRLRAPRLLKGTALQPYEAAAASGSSILAQLDGRKYAATDEYQYHVNITSQNIMILTDRRILIAALSDVFGTWQVTLSVLWSELASPPAVCAKGIMIVIDQRKRAFKASQESKVIPIANAIEREFVATVMNELYFTENKQLQTK